MAKYLRAHQLPKGQYPTTARGLAKYLQETEGIDRELAVRCVNRIFVLVRTTVMEQGMNFTISGFGMFWRRLRPPRQATYGPVPEQYVLAFWPSRRRGRIRLDD